MRPAWKAFFVLLFSIAGFVCLGTAFFIGLGALLARWLPLSLFQASGLAIGATLAVVAIIHVLSDIMHSRPADDDDDDFDDEQDDFEPDVPLDDALQPKPDFSRVGKNDYCPCGSGRKFKNCCEKMAFK